VDSPPKVLTQINPGQIAHETYWRTFAGRPPTLPWAQLIPDNRDAWEAAAQAVLALRTPSQGGHVAMTPDATPERDTANLEARLAAHPRILAPRCADCGRAINPLGPYTCPQHPDALVLYRPEPSYLTWSNALVVLLGFALAFWLALLTLGG
jgi:hypothetical protein